MITSSSPLVSHKFFLPTGTLFLSFLSSSQLSCASSELRTLAACQAWLEGFFTGSTHFPRLKPNRLLSVCHIMCSDLQAGPCPASFVFDWLMCRSVGFTLRQHGKGENRRQTQGHWSQVGQGCVRKLAFKKDLTTSEKYSKKC